MCRKLMLTGWVLLIGPEFELARLLMAILITFAGLALHLSVKPLKR